ncbi:hypothetical protein [Sphingobacterium thalpophilum]|uniref:Uncharacterized protein n=1 Tax=Sphingobacterium thalpophilum TaxID=259 RepID=A0A4U9VP73_9SPHI|nr:hypothetical protein [Sphingobacterium thalpophilum]VTR49125.1 Uncharacterised protein [Sphingobacterium thalpophilum]
MSHKVFDYWNDLLITSTVENHCFYRLNELYKIPKSPGIYAWYLIADQPDMSEYHKVFKQKSIKISVEGNLSEGYVGRAKATFNQKHFTDLSIDRELCKIASMAFSPPLYIGISSNLNKRLSQHAKELTDIYYDKVKLVNPSPVRKTEFDTIIESQHFAQRIGYSIKSFRSIQLGSLLIRTIEMPKEYTWQDLQGVEKYLNRIYTPLYGRK